ncbi:pyruvate dehydrogenase E2 component (dihydrolipoamide acetyltransferase) [Burkholderiales bacterium]|nr:pyruvate dehydrogenase E2 component (dihydrolipoamide acetyltransferase) [Burkholderiales bacterium]
MSAELAVPQLGEGLREVRIVEILRRAGDAVLRGEPIYVVETDKSTVELEAPFDGTIEGWTVSPGDVVQIGAVVARIVRPGATVAASGGDAPRGAPQVPIPPRTRAHARERGIGDSELARIPSASGKLMPADVDAWLARSGAATAVGSRDEPLSPEQRRLVFRLRRSAERVVPGTIAVDVRWSALADAPALASGGRPSPVQVLAHAAAQVAAGMPRFRATLVGDDTLRTFDALNVGIALARPGDGLVTAVVRGADRLSLDGLCREARRQMREALRTGDQAGEDTQLLVSHLGREGIVDAVPTLVAPATAILFLGAPRDDGRARLVLTFDHRVHNGAGAATFLAALRDTLGA